MRRRTATLHVLPAVAAARTAERQRIIAEKQAQIAAQHAHADARCRELQRMVERLSLVSPESLRFVRWVVNYHLKKNDPEYNASKWEAL